MVDYQALFNEAPNPYLVLDRSLKIVEVNKAYLNATMTKRDTLLGKYLFEAFPANPEDLNANGVSNLQASMDDVRKYRKPDTMAVQKYDIPKQDGSSGFEERFWCSVNSPVLGPNNEVDLIIHNAQDVTEFMRGKPEEDESKNSLRLKADHLETEIYKSAQALQEANKKLKIANDAKSTFLTSMSHELRTPLTVILGFTQILGRDMTLGKEQREEIGIINRSGQHLLNLINEVLDISKIETGQVTLNEKSFDLISFLDHLSDLFRPRAVEKGLIFTTEKGPDLPGYMKGDEGKLRQVLINLLGNALKFTEVGSVTFRVRSGEAKDKTRTLQFEVEDTGVGIDSDNLKKIFEPFFQVSNCGDKTTGTGLGLTISKQYVQLMGGNLEVESQINKGSLFRFSVATGKAEPFEVAEIPPSRRVSGLAPGQPSFRILVVDDILESRKLLVKVLQTAGFEIQEASDGKQAVEAFDSWHPHLIWMDMRMPVMDGYEATKQIKKSERGRETVIIALTAHVFEEERQEILNIGCDDFIRKPYLEEELFAALEKHLGVKFIFEDVVSNVELPKILADERLSPEGIAGLSIEAKSELLTFAAKLDQKACLSILDRLSVSNKKNADALRILVENYKFKDLENLLRARVIPGQDSSER
ncbi:MAG: response regulator [Candidatus Riflebacteria bacterium]|nr:response regulator [Candidatus Riflebacteria bacterium]